MLPLNSQLPEKYEDFLTSVTKGDLDINLNNCPENVYTLTKRVSTEELYKNFLQNVSDYQETYKNSIIKALTEFKTNLKMCKKMDERLGKRDLEDDITTPRTVSKDGSLLLKCPVNNCLSKTYRLKRHLADCHKDLKGDHALFALEVSRQIENNKEFHKENKSEKTSSITKTKKISLPLVSRKYNYKKCELCKNLYLNMSDHVQKHHKIKKHDVNYSKYVLDPPTIPKCYTKKEGKRIVELSGDELNFAKLQYGDQIEEQRKDLKSLTQLRQQIEKTRKELKECKDNSCNREEKKKELNKVQEDYNKIRYPDKRTYSDVKEKWKKSYLKYLSEQNYKGTARIQRMAFDVIFLYEEEIGKSLDFEEICKPLVVKDILIKFRNSNKFSNLSKAKYVGQFGSFLKYLMVSIDSPELVNNQSFEEITARKFAHDQITLVIENELNIIHRMKGKDIMQQKKKAKSKIVTDEEMNKMMEEATNFLKTVEHNISVEKNTYSIRQILKIRDSLMALAVLRLGRRSLEITQMRICEVETATKLNILNEDHWQVDVEQQKNEKSGEPAPVVFSDMEYKILRMYIKELRPKLCDDINSEIVFTTSEKFNSKADQELGLSGLYKVLQKYKTEKGKSVSSRTIRGSRVTNNQRKNLSDSQLNKLANAMSHKRSTAERFYNYDALENSVIEAVVINSTLPVSSTSTPSKRDETIPSHDLDISGIPKEASHPDSNLRTKRVLSDSSSSDEELVDKTLRVLRSKKIKTTGLKRSRNKKKVRSITQ